MVAVTHQACDLVPLALREHVRTHLRPLNECTAHEHRASHRDRNRQQRDRPGDGSGAGKKADPRKLHSANCSPRGQTCALVVAAPRKSQSEWLWDCIL